MSEESTIWSNAKWFVENYKAITMLLAFLIPYAGWNVVKDVESYSKPIEESSEIKEEKHKHPFADKAHDHPDSDSLAAAKKYCDGLYNFHLEDLHGL